MNPVTQERVDKAEADFHVALRESRARKHRSLDALTDCRLIRREARQALGLPV